MDNRPRLLSLNGQKMLFHTSGSNADVFPSLAHDIFESPAAIFMLVRLPVKKLQLKISRCANQTKLTRRVWSMEEGKPKGSQIMLD